jgi:predicted RNA-binding Zn-ribbon protein involved in translation (DUF1610 family)
MNTFTCPNCGEKYYSAASLKDLQDSACEKCGAELKED